MLIDAVVEKGQVRLLQPIRFVHDYFSVKVDIPDREVIGQVFTQGMPAEVPMRDESQPAVLEYPDEFLAFKTLQEVAFGKQYKYAPEKTDREIMQEHWMEKYA